jgi:6-pyruvoyl-tetrahydropterin synthase
MVADFSAARAMLKGILADLQNKNLNEIDALAGQNPTAEVLAKYLFERIRAAGMKGVYRVEVTEAPGCLAAYEAPFSADGAETRGSD